MFRSLNIIDMQYKSEAHCVKITARQVTYNNLRNCKLNNYSGIYYNLKNQVSIETSILFHYVNPQPYNH